jgi:hypothetical protein
MAETKIEWCDFTFNPWYGCTKVSPGCDHCYAEHMMDTRMHKVKWGAGNPRVRTTGNSHSSGTAKRSGDDPSEFCGDEGPYWGEIKLRDRKGGDMQEWPQDLRVRESPILVDAP